jgi:hypothetical protein
MHTHVLYSIWLIFKGKMTHLGSQSLALIENVCIYPILGVLMSTVYLNFEISFRILICL